MNQKGFSPILLIIILAALALAFAGGYFFSNFQKSSAPSPSPALDQSTLEPSSTPNSDPQVPNDWKTFT